MNYSRLWTFLKRKSIALKKQKKFQHFGICITKSKNFGLLPHLKNTKQRLKHKDETAERRSWDYVPTDESKTKGNKMNTHELEDLNYCNACHLLAHENDNECPVWDGETATHNGILTLGQFLEIVKGLPLDTQIVTDDQNGWYWNVTSVQLPTNPDDTGYMAITLNTANTFDARQF